MLLAIDVGNTQTVLGLFEDSALGEEWRISTEVQRTGDELGALLETLLRARDLCLGEVTAVALSCVVPTLNREYEHMARRYLGIEPLIVGPGVKTGMPILTSNPREVGADLIVDAVSAFETVGGPCVVVDFGTATTFGAVSDRGEYLGHVIAPGIQTAMDALAARAAKLPRVELSNPGTVIGKTTVHSMQSGAVFGFAGQVDGIVSRMRVELGAPTAVSIATGGLAPLLFDHAATLDRLDEHLTLRGLEIIYRRNQ